MSNTRQKNATERFDQFPFLKLPAELRVRVYEQVAPEAYVFIRPAETPRKIEYDYYTNRRLEDTYCDDLWGCRDPEPVDRIHTGLISLLQASSHIYKEFVKEVYDNTHFNIIIYMTSNMEVMFDQAVEFTRARHMRIWLYNAGRFPGTGMCLQELASELTDLSSLYILRQPFNKVPDELMRSLEADEILVGPESEQKQEPTGKLGSRWVAQVDLEKLRNLDTDILEEKSTQEDEHFVDSQGELWIFGFHSEVLEQEIKPDWVWSRVEVL